MEDGRKLAVVLGGGGMKGLAHIGALKVLHRWGFVPDEYVGTSVGSYIAALAAGGLPVPEMEQIALSIRQEDILDFNWWGLLTRRGRSSSLYRGKAVHDFFRRTLPFDRFDQLIKPLFITSVDLDSGREVVWGMPGFTEIPLHDCVVASCSIPGIYPPKKINRFHFVDGSLVDSLPVKVAVYRKVDLIVAVYLEPKEITVRGVNRRGMAAVLQQAQSIFSRTLVHHNLNFFQNAPIVLIQPQVQDFGLFDFENHAAVIRAGEMATEMTLRAHPLTAAYAPSGLPPTEATPSPFPASPGRVQ